MLPLGDDDSARRTSPIITYALIVIGFWIVLQVVSSPSTITASSQTGGGGVAYMAHVGGFLAGIVLTFILGARTDRRLPSG